MKGKMIGRLVYILMTLMFLTSCSEKYTIAGSSSQSSLDGKMAYIKLMEDNIYVPIDSCEVIHGQFIMSGVVDTVRFVSLFMDSDNFIPLVLEQGEISVSLANSSVKVTGTPLNEVLYSFLTSRDSLMMLINELPMKESKMYLDGYTQDEIDVELGRESAELNTALDKLETNFILNNSENILGVSWFMELCNSVRMRFGYPTTTPQIDEIYGRAPESFRKNPAVEAYMKLVNGGH